MDKVQQMTIKVHNFGKSAIISSTSGDESNIVDPFTSFYDVDKRLITPPFPLYPLGKMVEISDILSQCISAMAVNIDGFGWELARFDDPTGATPVKPEAKKESEIITDFLNSVNDKESFTTLRKRLRWELESYGEAHIEILRNLGGGISEMQVLPSWTCRRVTNDKNFTEYVQKVRSITGSYRQVKRRRKFGRIAQVAGSPQKIVYFKEFGDPRKISSVDGYPISKKNISDPLATEVLSFRLPCTYSPYGLPRWIGNMMAILGSRKAEEINYLFFDNKTIPPLIITVSGGALTQETIDKLEHIFEKEIKGIENFHKALILEATPHSASDIPGEKVTPVRIEVKPLTEYLQKDATFGDYRANNRSNIRSSFKLPPIFTGDTVDYTRATAYESARVAEEQVFEPDRRDFDEIVNLTIFAEFDINFWSFRSLGAKTSADSEIVTALGTIKEAVPVGILMEAAAELRNVPRGDIDPSWYQIPLGLMVPTLAPQPTSTSDTNIDDRKENGDNQPKKKPTASEIAKYIEDRLNN